MCRCCLPNREKMGRNSQLFELQSDPWGEKASDGDGHTLRVCLFRDVKNANELRQLLHDRELDCAIVRAELILEIFQLLAAANRAVHSQTAKKMATRGLHSEIVYSLSPSKNITDSLHTFGINETSVNILVAILDDVKGDKMNKVGKRIKGRATTLAQLKNISDYDLVKRVYHVRDPELNAASITDAIVTRIVSKDYVA